MVSVDQVRNHIDSLHQWIKKNSFYGYDPYDFKGQNLYVKLIGRQNFFFRKIRGLANLIEYNLPPLLLRKVLGIKKTVNPKGMGLLASSYLSLYRVTRDSLYLTEAEEVLDWLYNNRNNNHMGFSWGYPFHWQSRIFLERGTPSSVVTGTIGDAWLDHYLITGSKRSLKVCNQIADFFLSCLNRHHKSDQEFCFSYTPSDNFRVHNASLFVAAFLSRLSFISSNKTLKEQALGAVKYTISEQNPDGSFNYWGSEPQSIIDHYHTGFVLRHLDTVRKSLNDESFSDNIKIGYQFYKKSLFNKNGIPKFTPETIYPIDIHSCAEAILCLNQFEDDPLNNSLTSQVIEFTEDNMLSSKGYYIAQIRKRFWGEQKVNIPYMRWGQCWMLLAFTKLYEKISKL